MKRDSIRMGLLCFLWSETNPVSKLSQLKLSESADCPAMSVVSTLYNRDWWNSRSWADIINDGPSYIEIYGWPLRGSELFLGFCLVANFSHQSHQRNEYTIVPILSLQLYGNNLFKSPKLFKGITRWRPKPFCLFEFSNPLLKMKSSNSPNCSKGKSSFRGGAGTRWRPESAGCAGQQRRRVLRNTNCCAFQVSEATNTSVLEEAPPSYYTSVWTQWPGRGLFGERVWWLEVSCHTAARLTIWSCSLHVCLAPAKLQPCQLGQFPPLLVISDQEAGVWKPGQFWGGLSHIILMLPSHFRTFLLQSTKSTF